MSTKGFRVDYLNNEISDLISKCDQKTVAIWACDCSQHVMHIFENEYPEDKRPSEAIEALKAWINDEISMWNARKSAFPAHRAAREVNSEGPKAVARASGHAVATAHVKSHAMHAATYAVKAEEFVGGDVKEEREWQYERLKDILQTYNSNI